MKNLLLIFVLVSLYSLSSFAQGDNNNEIELLRNKEYTNKIMFANGEIKESGNYGTDMPLGNHVTLVYDIFFKNYTIVYIDSRGKKKKIIFDYSASKYNVENQMALDVSLNGVAYTVLNLNPDGDHPGMRYMFFFNPKDIIDGNIVTHSDQPKYSLSNLQLIKK